MPNALGRNLHLCFTKLKRPLIATDEHPDFQQSSSRSSPTSTTTTTTTSSSSSPVLIKNYNSLYDHNIMPESTSMSLSRRTSDDFSSDSDTYDAAAPPPDFAAVFASQRFFFSSPGRSNSIIESQPGSDALVGGGVPIPTYSPDPYMDFRRSMQEMVESRHLSNVTADWDYLHELLLCYLALNPKHAHKFIIGAFADLLFSLMESTTAGSVAGWCRKSNISGRCASPRQVV